MGSTFNPQILIEKLTKLNNSQQSIETLSHWCIFHMNKAKLVVETWERQFHNSPRERRLAFLYLANDILQNSRRKGAEFVAEFWRVLPEALRDVIRNGDEFGKNAALRLISIWDERKVFGSRGHILKEEFMGRQPENNVNKTERQLSVKLRQSSQDMLGKIISDFEAIYGGQLDEDALLSRCINTNNSLEKVIKDIGGGINPGKLSGSEIPEELQSQHAALKECIDNLLTLEASRSSLVSHLRDALQEQESKLDQVRSQLQAAQSRSDQVANISQQLVTSDNNTLLNDQTLKEARSSSVPPGFTTIERQSNAVVYTRQLPLIEKPPSINEPSRKSAAAAMAAQLTNSSSSAEMLTHVLTSFVSGVAFNESQSQPLHLEKKPKLENEASSYAPPPPLPPFPQPMDGEQPPPPSSSPPPLPPLPPMPLYPMPPHVGYNYALTQQPSPPPLSGYPYGAPPFNAYQPLPGSEGGFYSPSSAMAPISR